SISSYEAKIGRREASEVGKDGGKITIVDAEPGRERGKILVDRGRGYPAAGAGIVWSVNCQIGKCAIGFLAFHRSAQDQMMAAPAVVAALAVAGEGSAEIAGGEGSYLL